jgi:hypothetical protein
VLGPLPIDATVFESAGAASGYDGATDTVRFAFTHRAKLFRGAPHVSYGPGPVAPPPEPGRVVVYIERVDSAQGVFDATFNDQIRPDEAHAEFEKLCAAIAYGSHGPRDGASGFTRTIDGTLVTLAVHDRDRTHHRFTCPPELQAAAAACPPHETIDGLRVSA